MNNLTLISYKVISILLLISISFTVIYTIATDGSPLRSELLKVPWLVATLIDFYINVIFLYAWIFYKEESRISRGVWLVLMICTGSAATALCTNFLKKFFVSDSIL